MPYKRPHPLALSFQRNRKILRAVVHSLAVFSVVAAALASVYFHHQAVVRTEVTTKNLA